MTVIIDGTAGINSPAAALTTPLPVTSGGTGATSLSGITTGTSTNLANGSAGTVPYQSASGTTAMLAAGIAGQFLTSAGAAAPTWTTLATNTPIGTDIGFTDFTLTLPTALTTVLGYVIYAVALDATREVLLLLGDTSLQAVVYDSSSNTFGSVVLLRSGAFGSKNSVAGITISSSAILVSSLAVGTTALETVVLSVSGSTITVNTAVATTLAVTSSIIQTNTRYVLVGTTYVLNYFDSTTGQPRFRAVTVSGITPTIGSELIVATGSALLHSYAYSSTILLSVCITNSTTVFAQPISVSGTTLTSGTVATVVTSGNVIFTGVLSTGRIALVYVTTAGTTVSCALISVSGTTASITIAANTYASAAPNPQMQVFGNQAVIISGRNITDDIGVLTDTAGVPTIGPVLPLNEGSQMSGFLSTGKVFMTATSASNGVYTQYGISGSNLVVEKTFSNTSNNTIGIFTGTYVAPLSGPPNSSNQTQTTIRTPSGKFASAQVASANNLFSLSINGNYAAKVQQAPTFQISSHSDALFPAVAWVMPLTLLGSGTTATIRRIQLS